MTFFLVDEFILKIYLLFLFKVSFYYKAGILKDSFFGKGLA